MKRKLLTIIILGICMSSMIISCGDSEKDNSKKETKTVETSNISAEKSTKTAETSIIEKKETETVKNEENSSEENKTNEQDKNIVENNENNENNTQQQVVSNNEDTTNNVSSNNNTEVNTSNGSTSSSENSNTSSSEEQKVPEQVETPKSIYKDGTYTGYGEGMNGKVKVNVTISGDKIISISVGENSEDEEYLGEAKGVIDRIIASQSTSSVDVVSGATYSSNGIIGGVNEALSKAKN